MSLNLNVPKEWFKSKTILTAIVWALTMLASVGVKWANPENPKLQDVANGAEAIVNILGAAGVITFRANATQAIKGPTP